MPKESPAAWPKSGNMDRMVFSEDQLGKRLVSFGRTPKKNPPEIKKEAVVSLLVCVRVWWRKTLACLCVVFVWPEGAKAYGGDWFHLPEAEAGACPDSPIPSWWRVRSSSSFGPGMKALQAND